MKETGKSELVGPILYKPGLTPGTLVPDYSRPGVKERIAAEVDEMEDFAYDRRKPR